MTKIMAHLVSILISAAAFALYGAVFIGILLCINAPTWIWVCFWIYLPIGLLEKAIDEGVKDL